MIRNEEITSLLVAWNEGDTESLERLLPVVEVELRRIAHAYMRRESPDHTLQTTALLNEAYLKLLAHDNPKWKDRSHFFGIAANIMRRILINHARDRMAEKRGGADARHVPVDDELGLSDERSAALIALDEALTELARFDPVKSKIVELKCFGGLTAAEISEVLGIPTPTINLYWRLAKAWLAREMRSGEVSSH